MESGAVDADDGDRGGGKTGGWNVLFSEIGLNLWFVSSPPNRRRLLLRFGKTLSFPSSFRSKYFDENAEEYRLTFVGNGTSA